MLKCGGVKVLVVVAHGGEAQNKAKQILFHDKNYKEREIERRGDFESGMEKMGGTRSIYRTSEWMPTKPTLAFNKQSWMTIKMEKRGHEALALGA